MLTDSRKHRPVEVPPALPGASVDAVRQSVHAARAALAELLGAAGIDATKTRESARLLDVNRGLVWRVSRVVSAEDDVTAASNMPGPAGLERLLEACRTRGAPEPVIASARSAVMSYRQVADTHFDDRRTVEIVLANDGDQGNALNLERARRSFFDGGCAVWGVRADVRLRSVFLTPNRETPDTIDQTDLAGYVGFRRLRPIPWPMGYRAIYSDTGATDAPQQESIDLDGPNGDSLPLIREFCSPGLTVQAVPTPNAVRHELPASSGASTSPVNCIFGSICRRLYPTFRTDQTSIAGSLLVIDTPVERVIFDIFVHRSLNIPGIPTARLLDRMTRPHGFNQSTLDSESLPMELPIRRLVPGAQGAVTPHVPWLVRLTERVCSRLGYASDEFIAHRIELTYPPFPTSLIAMFNLPDRPSDAGHG